MAAAALRQDQLDELKAIFDLFDADGDGLLEVEEVGTIWAACGTVLTEAELLDMVTEARPSLRKLPFDEFVQMMTRRPSPMARQTLPPRPSPPVSRGLVARSSR